MNIIEINFISTGMLCWKQNIKVFLTLKLKKRMKNKNISVAWVLKE